MSQMLNGVKEADSGASLEWNFGWNDIIVCCDGNEEERPHFTQKNNNKKTKKWSQADGVFTICITACVMISKQECTSLVTTTRPCTESTFSEKWLIVLFLHKTRTDDSSVSGGDPSYLFPRIRVHLRVPHVLSDISSPSPPRKRTK